VCVGAQRRPSRPAGPGLAARPHPFGCAEGRGGLRPFGCPEEGRDRTGCKCQPSAPKRSKALSEVEGPGAVEGQPTPVTWSWRSSRSTQQCARSLSDRGVAFGEEVIFARYPSLRAPEPWSPVPGGTRGIMTISPLGNDELTVALKTCNLPIVAGRFPARRLELISSTLSSFLQPDIIPQPALRQAPL